jgi:hypothetical protein
MKRLYLINKNLHEVTDYLSNEGIAYKVFKSGNTRYIGVEFNLLDEKQLYQVKKLQRKV